MEKECNLCGKKEKDYVDNRVFFVDDKNQKVEKNLCFDDFEKLMSKSLVKYVSKKDEGVGWRYLNNEEWLPANYWFVSCTLEEIKKNHDPTNL